MGNDNSKDSHANCSHAYPQQQYEYDKQQQIAQQKAQTHHHQHHPHHQHHHHHHNPDAIQPKPQAQVVQVPAQYVAVPTQQIANQPVNPYYGTQPMQPIQQTYPIQQLQQPQAIPQQIMPVQQSAYPTLAKPATVATIAATQHQIQPQPVQAQPIQPQPIQPQPIRQPIAPIVTGAIVANQIQQAPPPPTNPNTITQQTEYKQPAQPIQPIRQQIYPQAPPPVNPQYVAQQQQIYQQPQLYQAPQVQPGYVQVKGADGKQYIVPQGPKGTVPVIVAPEKPKPKPKPKRKKYKTWGVKIIPTSDQAKNKVRNQRYEKTAIVIGIVCDGDKFDGYNRYGSYGQYGHSNYGDLDRKKFITMKVKVTDQIAIQQNTHKHYLEFWKNGQMYKQVIALDKNKKFQIRVGSTNHDYDVKLY